MERKERKKEKKRKDEIEKLQVTMLPKGFGPTYRVHKE